MEVGTVKKQIKNRALDKFYIFTGDEITVMDIYIQKIIEVSNKQYQRIESVADVYNTTRGLFGKAKCFVCTDDMEFTKLEKAWSTIENALNDNMLILRYTDIDKRGKFYKYFADRIVDFKYMNEDTLVKYITKVIDVPKPWCKQLIDVCECDYGRALLEAAKVDAAWRACEQSMKCAEVLRMLLEDGTIYKPPKDAIFDWCDAALKNDRNRAFDLLEQCKQIGEPALRLIQVLYNNAKKVLQVQACESSDIEKSTGLSNWDIKCVQDKIGKRSTSDLVGLLRVLRMVETSIKTGKLDEAIAIDYVMIYLF